MVICLVGNLHSDIIIMMTRPSVNDIKIDLMSGEKTGMIEEDKTVLAVNGTWLYLFISTARHKLSSEKIFLRSDIFLPSRPTRKAIRLPNLTRNAISKEPWKQNKNNFPPKNVRTVNVLMT